MTVLSRKGATVHAAVLGYVLPRLATDAKVDLKAIFNGVTNANYVSLKPALALGVANATAGKLAKDAKLDDLSRILAALDAAEEEEEKKEEKKEAKDSKDCMDRKRGRDAMPEAFMKHMEGKMGKDAFDKMCEDMEDYEAEDEGESDEERKKREEMEAKDKRAKDRKARDEAEEKEKKAAEDNRKAMDAAISKERDNQREIRDAEKFVRPWVGDIAIACDSASGVFESALKMLSVKTDGVHPSAFKTILELQPKPGQRTVAQHSSAIFGMDAGLESALKTAPDIARIGIGEI